MLSMPTFLVPFWFKQFLLGPNSSRKVEQTMEIASDRVIVFLLLFFRVGWLSRQSIVHYLPRAEQSIFQTINHFLEASMVHFAR